MSPSIEKSHQNQDEVICFQGPSNFKMDGSRIHTYKDGFPSLLCNLSPSSLHVKRAKIVNSWIRERWLVRCQPNLRQFCHFLSHPWRYSFLAGYRSPNNLFHCCSSFNHPELLLEKGQYLLDSTISISLMDIAYQNRSDMVMFWQDHRIHCIRSYRGSWNPTTNSQDTITHDHWFKLHNIAWRLPSTLTERFPSVPWSQLLVHFLLYLKFLFRNFLELGFWTVILTSTKEGWAFQSALIFERFIHLKASTNFISRVQFARTMSPLFCIEVSCLSNWICQISLKSPALIVNIVQSNQRVTSREH